MRGSALLPTVIACMLAGPLAVGAQTPPPAAPCPLVTAVLDDDLDSAHSRVGQPVHFTLADATRGTGIVDFVRGARRGGGAGQIGIEARFVERADGTHVPATLVTLGTLHESVVDGSPRNVPLGLAAIGVFRPTPYQIAAGLIGAYGALHFGSQAVLRRGTPLQLALGDDVVTGACSVARP